MTLLKGQFVTPNASKYMQQLCKHFAHKTEASADAETGRVSLSVGEARFRAWPDRLEVEMQLSRDADIPAAQNVIDRHLVRFAFREAFQQMDWDVTSDP